MVCAGFISVKRNQISDVGKIISLPLMAFQERGRNQLLAVYVYWQCKQLNNMKVNAKKYGKNTEMSCLIPKVILWRNKTMVG